MVTGGGDGGAGGGAGSTYVGALVSGATIIHAGNAGGRDGSVTITY